MSRDDSLLWRNIQAAWVLDAESVNVSKKKIMESTCSDDIMDDLNNLDLRNL